MAEKEVEKDANKAIDSFSKEIIKRDKRAKIIRK